MCIAIRRSDLMPVCAIGNLEGLLSVTLQRMRENIETLLAQVENPEDRHRFWNAYHGWDSTHPLTAEFGMQNGS